MASEQDGTDITTEIRAIIDRAQAAWDAAEQAGTIPDPGARSEVGSIKNYMDQLDGILAALAAGGTPAPPGPGPDPDPAPPDPPAVWHGPAPGFYTQQRYGSGPRCWGNLTIPQGTPHGLLIQVHGGGWMQGDPFSAGTREAEHEALADAYVELLGIGTPFYQLQQMASYAAARWHVIVWEPAYTYSSGNPDVCLADVEAAIRWAYGKLADWGVPNLPVVFAGHSAGGHLSLRAALDPGLSPPHAWLGMAAAGLSVHTMADLNNAPGGFGEGGTGWIFRTAWGADASRWPGYAPDTHLRDRPERFKLYIEQGTNDGGNSDGSVLVRWASTFAGEAGPADWPGEYRLQPNCDHFAVRWDQSAQTRADMDTIWSEV